MTVRLTSYYRLFDDPSVARIEIPRIQRDYAQGRKTPEVERIRIAFLDVLRGAVEGGAPVDLDFVYGDVTNGTLAPLDGQQRLTTLFLLHWYAAARAGALDPNAPWTRFSYAVRPSARTFCERLVAWTPPPSGRVSEEIVDQPWYRAGWRHDPTIQGMLVMLDAIQSRFDGVDWAAAWSLLTGEDAPIRFHLLLLEDMGPTHDIYIKMNSRGKPLTAFENFKARFEQTLKRAHPELAEEFAHRVDVEWSDVFWAIRGDDDIIDDELMRYFAFVTDVCAWRADGTAVGIEGAEAMFGEGSPKANVEYLIAAFDTWIDEDISAFFARHFSREPSDGALRLFGPDSTNLFERCGAYYGQRRFSLSDTLLLFAVLVHRLEHTGDFPRRVRVLRNLLEASSNELRAERMPEHLADVERLIRDGDLDGVESFNTAQRNEELEKRALLAAHPEVERSLFRLEDEPLLRGDLSAFDLDATSIDRHAEAFAKTIADWKLWPKVTGALLVAGDYWLKIDGRFTRFGSGKNSGPWREVLTGRSRDKNAPLRAALATFLDAVAGADDPAAAVDAIITAFLEAREAEGFFDWRSYFVRYRIMRDGASGVYCGWSPDKGFEACMLDVRQMNSYYRDPYLSAVADEAAAAAAVDELRFTGYESVPRWLRLRASHTGLRASPTGWLLDPPFDPTHRATYDRIAAMHGVADDQLPIAAGSVDGRRTDTEDRIQRAAALLKAFVEAGL